MDIPYWFKYLNFSQKDAKHVLIHNEGAPGQVTRNGKKLVICFIILIKVVQEQYTCLIRMVLKSPGTPSNH